MTLHNLTSKLISDSIKRHLKLKEKTNCKLEEATGII